jgi:hypothetical protein
MPEWRPGQIDYHTATKAVNHGAPCTEDASVGIAIKQVAAPAGTGLGAVAINQVAIGEQFAIVKRGRVYVDNAGTGAPYTKGTLLYIITASNALTNAAQTPPTGYKFGRVVEVAGQRGVGTGKMRVDLDDRDSI